jgi:hypothetical protein
MKEGIKIKIRKNPYIIFTFALGLLALLLIIGNITKVNAENKSEDERLCQTISGTPAWASDGKILQYGEIIPQNISIDMINGVLIPNRIKFLYNPSCTHCEAQINYFKSQNELTWEEYQKEGLVVDCSKY